MGLFFLDLVLFGWILRLSNERGQTEFHCFFFFFKKVERGNKGWVVSVCELQFALHRACETDTSLGVGKEPKNRRRKTKTRRIKKKWSRFAVSFYLFGRVHILLVPFMLVDV